MAAILGHLGLRKKPFLSQSDAVDIFDRNWHQRVVNKHCYLPLLAFFVILTSCKNENNEKESKEANKQDDTKFFKKPIEEVPELAQNQLANEPTEFLRRQASSSIHWQPWSSEIITYAKKSQRLIFVCIGSTQYPQSEKLVQLLDTQFVEEINDNFVPVLADTETDPNLALACNFLSLEQRRNISFPFLLWLSHEGNPVAWIPVRANEDNDLLTGFRRAYNTIQTIREQSNRYIIENSRYDNENRLNRFKSIFISNDEQKKKELTKPKIFSALQRLADLYDPLEASFDNTGGIPPGNLITTLSRASQHPASPSRFKADAKKATQQSVEKLTTSAILDPLDHYFFSRRNSNSFAVPFPSKNLSIQAEMLSAISSAPPTKASQRAQNAMLTQLAKGSFQTNSVVLDETNRFAFYWKLNDLSEFLTDEELIVVKAAFNLQARGNIATNDDPTRIYFRQNTLGLQRFGSELATATNLDEEHAENLLVSASKKIETRRNKILQSSDSIYSESTQTLATQARLLTALAHSYASNPTDSTLATLQTTGQKLLADFLTEDGTLLRVPSLEGRRSIPAFAYDYAVTLEALLEWYRVTWDSQLIEQTHKLATQLLDNFIDIHDLLIEIQIENHPLKIPIINSEMIFGPSTWGISYGALARLKSLGYTHPKLDSTLTNISAFLQNRITQVPVIHTDFLLGALRNIDNHLLIISSDHKENKNLKNKLATAEFDHVTTIISDATSENLPPLGNKAALLLKDGETATSFSNSNQILSGLRRAIAK